jgi:hypothetical protein
MKRSIATFTALLGLAIGLASFTGSAIAGNGNAPGQEKKAEQAAPAAQPTANGNPSAPGQEKKAEQAAPAAQPAAAPAAKSNPGQAKKAAPSSTTAKSPGQAKQAAKASGAGVKPSSTTSKWTKCSTGGSVGSVTCSGNGSKADGSKQYGNGKTAAQIAVSRGAPAGTIISGPGNSQPHKVTVCGKPNNKSGGVDVHAIKNYSNLNCTPTQSQSVQTTSDCAGTTTTSTSSTTSLKTNKHGKVVAHGKKSVTSSITTSTFTPSGLTCGSSTTVVGTANNTSTSNTTNNTSNTAANTAANTANTANTSPTATAAGPTTGVAGVQATIRRPAATNNGVLGRLGTAATTGRLPFTGLPLWIAALAALALIAVGAAIRHSARGAELRLR